MYSRAEQLGRGFRSVLVRVLQHKVPLVKLVQFLSTLDQESSNSHSLEVSVSVVPRVHIATATQLIPVELRAERRSHGHDRADAASWSC